MGSALTLPHRPLSRAKLAEPSPRRRTAVRPGESPSVLVTDHFSVKSAISTLFTPFFAYNLMPVLRWLGLVQTL